MILCGRSECQSSAGCQCHLPKQSASIFTMPDQGHSRIPPAIGYPADYGLANTANALITQYGKDGAVNRLIEMAERIDAGEDTHSWVMRRRRVDPTAALSQQEE